MKKSLIIKALAACTLGALASVAAANTTRGFASPESVYVNNTNAYVSNLGAELAPLKKDGDGFISKLDLNGQVQDLHFLTGLNAPKGMAQIGDVLYVADIDRLVGFDLKTKRQVFEQPVFGAIFLNDLAVLNNNTLLVSDTGTGLILRVYLDSHNYDTLTQFKLDELGGPNGLLLDKKRGELWVAGYHPDGSSGGEVVKVNLNSGKITPVLKKKESYDGLAFDSKNNVYVSSWGENLHGVVYKINPKGVASALKLEALKGPADIFIKNNVLWIPRMVDGQVDRVKLKP